MKNSKFIVIALMSVTLISLEIVWTRIFSAEFFYTFAFLTLSLAILGLGLGALALRLIPVLNRKNTLSILLTLSALLALAGPPVVLNIKLDFTKLFSSAEMVWKFIATVLLLASPFFTGGIALAKLFRQNHDDMPNLYMADLIGAGLGGLAAVLSMNYFSTPWAAFLICLPMILAAFAAGGRLKYAAVVPLIAMIVLINYSGTLLNPPRKEHARVMSWYWDAMAKLKILDYGKESRGLNIDNVAHTTTIAFDGNWNRPDSMKFDFALPFNNLVKMHKQCTVLSLGAGGGQEVLQALQEGACEVHAVEVNPKINYLMTDGELAKFSGYIYRDKRVKVVTEDARAYVRRFTNKFDLILSFSSNTFAALASGSFALAENYLFTTEAFEDYYRALSDDGIFYMEHQVYMPKVVSEALTALERQGVSKPKEHIAVYNLPKYRRNLILISKKPLTDEIRKTGIVELTRELHPFIHLLYPCDDSLKGNLINRIVTKGWESVQEKAPIDITPNSDNRPYIAQLGLWKNLDFSKMKEITPYEFRGFPVSKLVVLMILAVILVLILPLMFLPYFFKGDKLKAKPWLYFFSIGLAFMIVEIVLIQRYTLFIGASAYSFITILLTLLISSGIGSKFSGRFSNRIPFIAIVVWLLLEILVFRSITGMLSSMPFAIRVLVSIILIAPLGFFMGMPFPKAALKAGELIDWGFAVNGVASVIGSAGIILITINFGFNAALIIAGLFYMTAYLMINARTGWS